MKDSITVLVAAKEYERAAALVSELETKDAAAVLSALDRADLVKVCHYVDSDALADILPFLDGEKQKSVVSGLREEKLDDVMDDVSVEDTVGLMEKLPASVAQRIVDAESIKELVAEKKFARLKALLVEMNEVDIAEVLDELDIDDCIVTFRLLPKDVAAETFVELPPDVQSKLIGRFTDTEIKGVIDELFIDDMADLIEEMPANVVKKLLYQSDRKKRDFLNEILRYPKDSTGSIMTVEFVTLSPEMTVREAFDKIRRTAIDKETIYTCYVTDKTRRLIGAVTAKDLLISDPEAKISDIMEDNLVYAHTLDDREVSARKLSNYGLLAIPVVDDEKRLVGIVTVDDAIEVLQEENTEDIAKMAATTPSDKPYLKTSTWAVFKNRIPWLLLLMVSATFTGLIINTYEAKLNAISTVLFACVPMLMDTGGNAGAQASVTVIRALAIGEVRTKDVFKVVRKELRVSLLAALVLGLACMAKLMLIDNLLFGYTGYTLVRCAVISVSLALTVIMAKLVGCTLPLIAKKCRLDPAVVASPFITTIVDALSLMVYCTLAIAVL